MKALRILLVDDHVFIRAGLRAVINAERDMSVVAEAADGRQALELLPTAAPDVAVVDLSMPLLSGAELTRQLQELRPGLKVLALTMYEDRACVTEMLAAGATGYLVKRGAAAELVTAIRSVMQGGVFLDPRIAGKMVTTASADPFSPVRELSPQESAVLQLVARGYSHKEIAAQLGVSLKTVETYKARAMEKMNLKTRVDVIRHAVSAGWFEREKV
jgi:DNA-binding NarL/FixJ family response regulator